MNFPLKISYSAWFMTSLLCLAGLVSSAQAVIEIRVSVKIILDGSGNRPAGGWNLDSEIQDEIDYNNQVFNSTGRGFQFQLTEIVELSGVSQWHAVAARSSANKNALEDAAEANQTLYAYRNNAINVYLNDGSGSGVCSFPGTGRDIILIGVGAYQGLLIHEIGHFFNLCHTQGCDCGSCGEASGALCATIPDSDELSDTLPDLSCWTRDQISMNAYGNIYDVLTTSQQTNVDNTWLNIMSYHNNIAILTPDQMDRWTDAANDSRANEVNGFTLLVDGSSNCQLPLGNRFCILNVGGPFHTVLQGVNAASSADIVLIKGGTYSEGFTTSRPVTLRNTRGSVLIRP